MATRTYPVAVPLPGGGPPRRLPLATAGTALGSTPIVIVPTKPSAKEPANRGTRSIKNPGSSSWSPRMLSASFRVRCSSLRPPYGSAVA